MNKVFSTVLITVYTLVYPVILYAQNQDMIERKLQKSLVESPGGDIESLVSELSSESVERVKAYLNHEKWDARQEAVRLLAHIPSESTSIILSSLRSKDDALRIAALENIDLVISDDKVLEAWAEAAARPDSLGDNPGGLHILEKLDEIRRETILKRFIPNVLSHLDEYSAYGARSMVTVLGKYAQPGDESVCSALKRLKNGAEMKKNGKWRTFTPSEVGSEDVLDAILYAEANLGDPSAFQLFRNNITRGEPKTKKRLIIYLHEFRATRKSAEMAEQCLDDKTDVCDYGITSNIHTPMYKRICDYAVQALSEWFPDFPVQSQIKRVRYKDEEIQQIKEWVQAKIQTMTE